MAGNNVEVGIKVGESLTIQVTDEATGAEMQLTLTADGMFIPVEPIPEPPNPDEPTEKIYKPEEFNGDFVAMGAKIITDQEAAGDGAMRAVVQFERGKTYESAKNNWITGVQRYRCEAIGQGNRPRLRNANRNAPFWIDRGPLCAGKGANCWTEPLSKTHAMALIDTAHIGDNVVTLKNAADASKFIVGRWHAIFSYCQQIGGYPPNCRWIEYVKVTKIDGAKISLDGTLEYNHFDDYWEDGDPSSLGRARIGLIDGAYNDVRCTLEGHFKGIEFVGEDQAGMDTTVVESHIQALFEDCIVSNAWPSMSKQVEYRNCILTGAGNQAAEPDKLGETIVFDNVTQAKLGQYVQAATGWMHMHIENSQLNCFSIKPRYLTIANSKIDSHGDTFFYVPCGWAFNGPLLEANFVDSEIAATTPQQPTWAYSQSPVSPLPLSAGSWQGNKLIIPRSFDGFERWLVWAYEGCMVFTGARVFSPGNYGRVDKIYAPPDGSALWCDVTWLKGTKPTSGNLNIGQHGLRKLVWQNTRITAGNWLEPDFVAMEGTPQGARGFPQGIS